MANSSRTLLIICAGLVILAGCSAPTAPASDGGESPQPASGDATVEGTTEVHFINVGQSVSTLIIGPTGETMLIDSGHFNDDGEYVLQYLQQQNIERIDYFVTSHNDADHIGGNAAVINYFETEADGIGAVYDPGIAAGTETYSEYLDAIEQHEVTLYETREGDSIPFENVSVQVMGPPEPYLESEARNENSIVLKLTYGQTSFLFTGDAEDDQEAYLVEEYGSQLRATVMKAGHHGSKTSTSGALLDAAQPQAVIISSEYESQYGHPNEETLQRLAERDISTYWTATHGHAVLRSDGKQVTIATQRAAPTDPMSIRDGSPIDPGTTGTVERRATITGSGVTDAAGTPTTIATDGGTDTSAEQGEIALASVHADAEGDDRENLNDEYIVLENTGGEPFDLSGWTVQDEAGATYTVPDGTTLDAGATITLHTGSGTDTETDLYWGSGSPIWNNGGDTVIITNADGDEVLRESYS
ncbi:lamin tail domain-containing protein [Haloglomus halophilum]|uniref:lamin tail domain-containing protein n=1 Tax=Haloglomus halophilum TaxID=2962672 RepID=UPI0020C9AE65|nr:lamin tail domain-containing protein [Haloglomus halophilum]